MLSICVFHTEAWVPLRGHTHTHTHTSQACIYHHKNLYSASPWVNLIIKCPRFLWLMRFQEANAVCSVCVGVCAHIWKVACPHTDLWRQTFFILICAGRRTLSTSWRPAETSSSGLLWESRCYIYFFDWQWLLPIWSNCLWLLCSDTETLVGLPRPIHESVKTLKQVSEGMFLTFSPSIHWLIIERVSPNQYSHTA